MASGFCYRVQKDVNCELTDKDGPHEKLVCDSEKLCGTLGDACPIAHDVMKIRFPRPKK